VGLVRVNVTPEKVTVWVPVVVKVRSGAAAITVYVSLPDPGSPLTVARNACASVLAALIRNVALSMPYVPGCSVAPVTRSMLRREVSCVSVPVCVNTLGPSTTAFAD
jgi:hypothetical protein